MRGVTFGLAIALVVIALALPAWAQPNVAVYVVDSGVRVSHQEFGGRAVQGPSFGGPPADCSGHGTHIAALAAGANVGVAKTALVISVRALDCNLVGTKADVIAAIGWVTQHYLSRGGPAVALATFVAGPTPWSDSDLDNALQASIDTGLTWVIAAGNHGDWVFNYTPARVERSVTVSAVGSGYLRPSWANYGPQVDLFARGVDVLSATSTSDSSYVIASGTSQAAARVAGAAAVILGQYPWAPADHVRNVLQGQASPVVVNPGPGTTSLFHP